MRPVVDQVRLFEFLDPVGYRPAPLADNFQSVRKVELALSVLYSNELEGVPDLLELERVKPQIDQAYLLLRIRRVPLLDDPDYARVLRHPTQPRRILELRHQHRRPNLSRAVPLDELAERMLRDKGPVSIHDQEDTLFLFYSLQSHPHRVTGTDLLSLKDRVNSWWQDRLHLFSLVTHDDQGSLRLYRLQRGDCVVHHRHAADRVQHLGSVGLHPGTLAGRQDRSKDRRFNVLRHGFYDSYLLPHPPPQEPLSGTSTGWGGRIRTCDPGTKTQCLAAWLRPKVRTTLLVISQRRP